MRSYIVDVFVDVVANSKALAAFNCGSVGE